MPPSTPPPSMPSRIDLHSHYLPPFYASALHSSGHSHPDGMPAVPSWEPSSHLSMMDSQGISRSILSISSPGTHLTPGADGEARSLTRRVNAYAADLKATHPRRFGYFASLPLPDVRGALEEIPVAAAEGCDGFVLETNHHGVYLGDPGFDPVFDELDRRGALVFVHPTTPRCRGGCGVGATPFAGRVPNPTMEFFFDTARVVANLFLGGTMRRCPRVRFVLPHLGGAFVPLLSRWTGFSALLPPGPGMMAITEEEVREDLARRVWFDLAGVPFPGQIRATMAGAGVTVERMVYGSDYPFTPAKAVEMLKDKMDEGMKKLFNEEEIEKVYRGNAKKLLGMK